MEVLSPKPCLILVTGDLICAGTSDELCEYKLLTDKCSILLYEIPANHDLCGEKETRVWEEIIGPLRRVVDVDGVRFILWNDIQLCPGGRWRAALRKERGMLGEALISDEKLSKIVAQHRPTLRLNADYQA